TAEEKGLEGWVFTLHFPSITPLLKYAQNRALREEIYLASASKCYKIDAYNNEQNIKDIISLRAERAKLLGFKDHAEFVLAERMAKNVGTVQDFLNDILQKAKPAAANEIKELKILAEKDGISELMAYDHA